MKTLLIFLFVFTIVLSFSYAQQVQVFYRCGQPDPGADHIVFYIKIVNTGSTPIALNSLTAQYYYTREGSSEEEYEVLFAAMGEENVSCSFDYNNGCLNVGFPNSTEELAECEDTGEIKILIRKKDYSAYNQDNDHSFDADKLTIQYWENITVEQNGVRIFGNPPGRANRNPASPPPTCPPTQTPTQTVTPTPAVTPTPTPLP